MALLAARLVPPAARDQLVQEAIFQAWNRRSSHDAISLPTGAFLLGLVAGRARRRRRRTRQTLELVDEAPGGPAFRDLDREFEDAIAALPARQRLAVDLHYFVGLDTADCAAVLRCSPDEADTVLERARSRLRDQLRSDAVGGSR